ncbi:hypothetical protein [Dictyobacter arantiisoli]|uniref:Uncharacterized protein n=1 Tax=Dictyobacter arantiisoli TaxID=2014874 RepID=A0A5A5TE94_9CHLR|nr:hypothetical protein [Dictyobacter arantiisoli]GCF09647.1 hypothetical protein KDI_32110 [Dictyobacter arantiisoli]
MRSPWIIILSCHCYRWLLALGPEEFRSEYGEQTLQVFEECCRDAYQNSGIRGVLALWPSLFSEALTGMLIEQGQQSRPWWPCLLALTLILIPFYWLSAVWSNFGNLFYSIFATTTEHKIGHAALFCILGLLIFQSFPSLRNRPLSYSASMLCMILGEELIHKVRLPLPINQTDLLSDLIGICGAYLVIKLWQSAQQRVSAN